MSSAESINVVSSLAAVVQVLLPEAVALQLHQVVVTPEGLTLQVASTNLEAICPGCEQPSRRVQSRYLRTLADLPWGQRPVRLQLQVRRFICRSGACPRSIFTERLPTLVQPYARRTLRLQHRLSELAFALGGEAGARQCQREGLRISPDTLLVTLRRQPVPVHPTPRVLGVDDWSFRRGRHMGTILVDLERQYPVDLLPDSSEESFAAWLEAHPGVEIISRDRGEIYAVGGRSGAPDATHVADRWHLIKNLGDAVQKLMSRQTAVLRQAASHLPGESPPSSEQVQAPAPVVKARRKRSTPPPVSAQRQRQLEMYEQVQALISQGWSVAAIAQHLSLSRMTVRKYRDMERFHDQRTLSRVSEVEPYRAYLEQRWAEGCTEAKQLWLELQAQGYQGRYKSVWQFTRYWELPETPVAPTPPPPPTAAARTPRQAMWLLMRPIAKLSEEEQAYREHMVTHCLEMARTESLVKEFQVMLREHKVAQLDDWLSRAKASGVRELRRFALGLQQDEAAVRAALEYKWSNGQVEGQVTKLKLVKRQMYGRAKFDLLRARVLHRA